jgi:hypothetical protein
MIAKTALPANAGRTTRTRQPKPTPWVETSQGATCGTSGAIQLPTSRTTALNEDVGGTIIYVEMTI